MSKGRPPSTKLLNEREMRRALTSGRLVFSPFTLRVHWSTPAADPHFDGILQVRWDAHDLESSFAFAIKPRWTALDLQRLGDHGRTQPTAASPLRPMVILPYLSEAHLTQLQEHGLSGLDLCGNGLLLDPPRLHVLHIGARSNFPTARAVPSIYQSRNLSTLVPRSFLLAPHFASAQAVLDACHARMRPPIADPAPLSLPTVSRALTRLEHDLAIVRKGRALRLTDPARILDGLERSFQPPLITGTHLGKTTLSAAACWSALEQHPALKFATTGRGSAPQYTGLAIPDRLQLYVSDLEVARQLIQSRETVAFPNVELLETTDEAAYFDARHHPDGIWASPIQTYLELSQASARERDVAVALRSKLLQAAASAPI